MVINSNPALAYLMRDNTLLLQVLTIAHVYGHNDFFKNNFTFKTTRAQYTIDTFKAHGDRVRHYVEDPSIGIEKVERLLDAAHALSLQCRRNLAIRKRSIEEERSALMEAAYAQTDPYQNIHRRQASGVPDLRKVPPSPDEDLLLFIRDHNPHLSQWQKDLLTIVHEEAQYFIPQIETKIMNEGWATFWHKRILDSLHLPEALHLEFIVRHNQVVRPFEMGLNPYHVGLAVWQDLQGKYGGSDDPNDRTADEKLFEVREADRDTSFLRRHLTPELMRELRLFEYENRGDAKVVKNVPDENGWLQVKETLLRNVGMNGVPVIKVEDADFGHNHTLYMVHYHDGRDLQLEYAEKTLAYLHHLWHGEVALETALDGKRYMLIYSEGGFSTKAIRF